MRHLLTTRRTVPLDRLEEYLEGWARVRTAAEARGAHAWLFRGAARDDHFIEFIEWRSEGAAGDGAAEAAGVAGARRALDEEFGHGTTEEWIEA